MIKEDDIQSQKLAIYIRWNYKFVHRYLESMGIEVTDKAVLAAALVFLKAKADARQSKAQNV